jgi:hypothetical protein
MTLTGVLTSFRRLSRDPVNFMSFKVTVDGERVSPRIEVRAVKDGKDITDTLRSVGLPVSVLDSGMKEAIKKLTPDRHSQLEKDELIVTEKAESGGKIERWDWPNWQTRVRFYWTQHFAGNSIVRVSHSYLPVVGGSYIAYDDDGALAVNGYCGTCATLKRIKQVKSRLARKQGISAALWERNIKYILTTANNWSGPIRDFRLGIDSDDPDDIVFTCFSTLKQRSPTHYEMNLSNFHPDRELDLMILQANR